MCGESTHRTEHCPKKALEIYQLPTDIKAKVDEQYERDVARMGHSTAGMESEYRSFLKVGHWFLFGSVGAGRLKMRWIVPWE